MSVSSVGRGFIELTFPDTWHVVSPSTLIGTRIKILDGSSENSRGYANLKIEVRTHEGKQ